MSLYKDASLVMIPSAYKDGKLYSIRPTDGSGDFTFSRGSNLAATRVDVNGLIEKGRENLFTNSNNLPNVTLDKLTRTTGHADPFGGSNAALFTEDTNTGSHRFYIFNIPATDAVYTYSIYAKPNGRNRFQIVADGGGINAQFNIADGTLIGDSNEIVSNIQSVGDGWYRISLTYYGAGWIGGYFFNDGGSNNYTGDGTSGVYLYGAQVEKGLVATDYIETGASTAQAGILEDMPRLDYSGSCPALLLEPQRTNVLSYSEYFGSSIYDLSANVTRSLSSTLSPEGKLNAYDITPNTSITNHQFRAPNLSGFTSGAVVTSSFFARANGYKYISVVGGFGSSSTPAVVFNLESGTIVSGTGTMEDYGNGWWRCVAPITLGGTALYCVGTILDDNQSGSFAGDGVKGIQAYGWQIEEGSYPTSYIPTYGSSVTRSADYNILDNASSLVGQTQGTLFAEYDFDATKSNGGGSDNDILSLADNTSSDFIKITHYGDGTGTAYKKVYLYQRYNSQYEVSISGPIQSTGTMKVAAVYSENYYALFVNGVKVGEDTNASVPTCNRVHIAKQSNGLVQVVNPRKQIVLFPTALTDSECIALTTL